MLEKDSAYFNQRILTWFDQHGRKHLPWQQDINAYRVWISEIMLQQTQVATVIPYFENFIARFPTVESLASSGQDEVLHYWSGLGYYSRAKNLHHGAKQIMNEFGGKLPQDVESLCTLKGIGRSTAGAISSIAYLQAAAILDGNVKRVIARHQGIAGWPGKVSTLNALWEKAEAFTPKRRTNDYSQAMMDLGATCCTRSKPNCSQCPVSNDCFAIANDAIADLPGKKPMKVKPIKTTRMLIIQYQQELLLVKRPLTGIWPGLHSFIEISLNDDVDAMCRHCLPHSTYTRHELTGFRHTFSHYHLDIHLSLITVDKKPQTIMAEHTQLWYNTQEPPNVGLAAAVNRIIKSLDLREKHP